MKTIIAIALLALSLFGPGWSSEHKAFWEWQLGHKLEGYQEWRLSRGWSPYGGDPLLNPGPADVSNTSREGQMCGGIQGRLCPTGYYCDYGPLSAMYPDQSGTCIPQPPK